VPKTARVEKPNNEQEELSIPENKTDGTKDVVGSGNESTTPESNPVDDVPQQVSPKGTEEIRVIPETQLSESPAVQRNTPPMVTDSSIPRIQNKTSSIENMDTSETDSVLLSSHPPLTQSKIPGRVAHTPSVSYITEQGKNKKGKKQDSSQQSSSGPPPRKTPKTQ